MQNDRNDLISRQAVIETIKSHFRVDNDLLEVIVYEVERLPSEQPCDDAVSRRAAIDAAEKESQADGAYGYMDTKSIVDLLNDLPAVQPERTCVNCGRTANNGGWYADGRTRCPIEEHYALPKDGYCHLWEKRNVTDDDYPERREK